MALLWRQLLCVSFLQADSLTDPGLNSAQHNPTGHSQSVLPTLVGLSRCQSVSQSVIRPLFAEFITFMRLCVVCWGPYVVLWRSILCVRVWRVWCVSLPLLVDTPMCVCVFTRARVCVVSAEISSNYLWPLIYFFSGSLRMPYICFCLCKAVELITIHGSQLIIFFNALVYKIQLPINLVVIAVILRE